MGHIAGEIPAYAKLLGDGDRADGFEAWMAQTLEAVFPPSDLALMSDEERARAESRLRISKIVVAACIEATRKEHAAGEDVVRVTCDVASIMGYALFGLAANVFPTRGDPSRHKGTYRACDLRGRSARDGTVRITTWGESRRKCDVIGQWGQDLWNYAVTVVPFRTVFGWGNEGVPKPLTSKEASTLSGRARQYAERNS